VEAWGVQPQTAAAAAWNHFPNFDGQPESRTWKWKFLLLLLLLRNEHHFLNQLFVVVGYPAFFISC
jgi:hypothetical protein